VLLERAYAANQARQLALVLGFVPVVLSTSNRVDHWSYDQQMYKQRYQRERLLRCLKGACQMFTRLEPVNVMFPGSLRDVLTIDKRGRQETGVRIALYFFATRRSKDAYAVSIARMQNSW